MFAAIYFWIDISVLGVITYSLFSLGYDIESLCRERSAPLWIGYVVVIGCVLLWPVFLLFLFTVNPRK